MNFKKYFQKKMLSVQRFEIASSPSFQMEKKIAKLSK